MTKNEYLYGTPNKDEILSRPLQEQELLIKEMRIRKLEAHRDKLLGKVAWTPAEMQRISKVEEAIAFWRDL